MARPLAIGTHGQEQGVGEMIAILVTRRETRRRMTASRGIFCMKVDALTVKSSKSRKRLRII